MDITWDPKLCKTLRLEKISMNIHELDGYYLVFNIAMENGPFIDGLPIKNGDFPWLC